MMLNYKKILLNTALISLISSCSSFNHNEKNELADLENKGTQNEQSSDSEKEKALSIHEIIDAKILCTDCIVGSSAPHDEDYGSEHRKIFYLYGAEELKLTNYYFDIPVVYNSHVKKWIHYFSKGRGRDLFARYANRASVYAPYASRILKEEGLPRDLLYTAMAESGFLNKARSHASAVGPWQFMSYTGKRYGLDINWYVDERRDPLKAGKSAAHYLKDLYNLFGSWELALAGYNAGEGKVGRAIKRYRTKNFWDIRNKRYLKNETKNYVPKIMALAIIGNNLSAFGFENIQMESPWNFNIIEVPGATDLYKISESLGIDFEELHQLNPELLRWETPHFKDSTQTYSLRVPTKANKIKWDEIEDKSEYISSDYMLYRVKNYSKLSDVANKFRVPKDVVAKINDLSISHKLAPHSVVKLPFRSNQSIRHAMYGDLYRKPRRYYSRKRKYKRIIKRAMSRGKKISNPVKYYVVQKGDSLWSVAQKTGVSIDTIIKSNSRIINSRMIIAGDKLAIK
jgi:membrane-bound lytic murein transglycosylase D